MSEQQVPADAGQAGGPTAGQLLRQAREAAGLHVAALAVALKVPVRKLEALEEDRFDLLPDAVFVRALASSVCRTLKIDPQPILERMPQTVAPRLVHDSDGINAPFRAPSDGTGPSWIDQVSKPVFLAVFVLLLGALVLVFLPGLREDTAQAEKSQVLPEPAPVVVAPAEPVAPPSLPAASIPAVAAAAVPVAAAATAPAVRSTPAAVSPTVSVPKLVSPTAVVTAQASATRTSSVTAAPPAGGTVVFKTSGESWIQVTDANGVTVLRRLMAAGESAGASGALPMAVTVGSASATEVQVRGKAFDLAPLARDNVARFEVK